MSNTFNIKRFWKYFCLDLLNAWRNFGLSAIIIGCVPVILYLIIVLYGTLVGKGVVDIDDFAKFFAYFIAVLIVIFRFPSSHYGNLTDKSLGSDWLMLPASTLEKFLSMLLVCCVVLPAVLGGLLVGTDSLLSVIAPNYGESAVSLFAGSKLADLMYDSDLPITFNMGYATWLNWCENILFFTLGAIFFKKAKVAKTMLSYMGFCSVLSILAILLIWAIFGNVNIDNSVVNAYLESLSPEKAGTIINVTANLVYLVVFALLDLGIFFRIKTLKH